MNESINLFGGSPHGEIPILLVTMELLYNNLRTVAHFCCCDLPDLIHCFLRTNPSGFYKDQLKIATTLSNAWDKNEEGIKNEHIFPFIPEKIGIDWKLPDDSTLRQMSSSRPFPWQFRHRSNMLLQYRLDTEIIISPFPSEQCYIIVQHTLVCTAVLAPNIITTLRHTHRHSGGELGSHSHVF